MLSLKKDTVLVFRGANGGGRRDFFEDNNRLGPTLALSNRKSSQQQDAAGRLSLETDEDGEESIKRCWTFNHPLLHNRNTSISLPLLLSVQSDSLIHQSSNQRFLSIALICLSRSDCPFKPISELLLLRSLRYIRSRTWNWGCAIYQAIFILHI